MSTNAPSGEIQKPPSFKYDDALGALTKAMTRLADLWEKGSTYKIEEGVSKKPDDEAPKKSKKEEDEEDDEEDEDEEEARAYEARRKALRKIAARKRAMFAEKLANPKKSEEEEAAQRAKLEELKSKIDEVKKRVEEAKKVREEAKMEAKAKGKAQVGAVSEEKSSGIHSAQTTGADGRPLPSYWGELLGASANFKKQGLLSSG